MSQPFLWFLLALTTFRLTRVITTDEWPPSDWFRNKVKDRMGRDSSWYTLVTCNWCAGAYVGLAVFIVASQLITVRYPVLQYFAALALTGTLGNYDD